MTIALADMTPETAFEQYRSNVEDFDQAAPMMLAEKADGSLTIFQIMGLQVRDALDAMYANGDRYVAVLVSVEARMWAYSKEGVSETEGPVDAAVIQYIDRTGKSWGVTRRFIRIKEGIVRWLDDDLIPMPGDGTTGAVPEGMARLVGADI